MSACGSYEGTLPFEASPTALFAPGGVVGGWLMAFPYATACPVDRSSPTCQVNPGTMGLGSVPPPATRRIVLIPVSGHATQLSIFEGGSSACSGPPADSNASGA